VTHTSRVSASTLNIEETVTSHAVRAFITLAYTADQTTSRGCCRTDAFTLQTGNIFLINRSAARPSVLTGAPDVSSPPSRVSVELPTWRIGGRFTVNLKGIVEKRTQSTRRRRRGYWLRSCRVLSAVSIAALVVPSAAELDRRSEGRPPDERASKRAGLRRCGYRLNYRPIQSEAGDRRRVRQPPATDRAVTHQFCEASDSFFLQFFLDDWRCAEKTTPSPSPGYLPVVWQLEAV